MDTSQDNSQQSKKDLKPGTPTNEAYIIKHVADLENANTPASFRKFAEEVWNICCNHRSIVNNEDLKNRNSEWSFLKPKGNISSTINNLFNVSYANIEFTSTLDPLHLVNIFPPGYFAMFMQEIDNKGIETAIRCLLHRNDMLLSNSGTLEALHAGILHFISRNEAFLVLQNTYNDNNYFRKSRAIALFRVSSVITEDRLISVDIFAPNSGKLHSHRINHNNFPFALSCMGRGIGKFGENRGWDITTSYIIGEGGKMIGEIPINHTNVYSDEIPFLNIKWFWSNTKMAGPVSAERTIHEQMIQQWIDWAKQDEEKN